MLGLDPKEFAKLVLKTELLVAKGGMKKPDEMHMSMYNPFIQATGIVCEENDCRDFHFPISMLFQTDRLALLEWALELVIGPCRYESKNIDQDHVNKLMEEDAKLPKPVEDDDDPSTWHTPLHCEYIGRQHLKEIDEHLKQMEINGEL